MTDENLTEARAKCNAIARFSLEIACQLLLSFCVHWTNSFVFRSLMAASPPGLFF